MKLASAIAVVGATVGVLAACSSGSGTGVAGGDCIGNNCSRGSTGRLLGGPGGSSGGGTSGGSTGAAANTAGSSSSGSTSGASSAGNSSGGGSSGGNDVTCANITAFAGDGGFCPGSWYGTRYADLGTCAPIAGATVEALDLNQVPIGSATTDAAGDFVFCLPAGSVYTPYVQAAGYPPSYLAQQNAPPTPAWIGLISTNTLGAVTGFLGSGYNASKGTVAVFFRSGANCPDQSGWTVTLGLPDGGAFPDGGYQMLYLDEFDLPDTTLNATSSAGSAIAVNVDSTISNYVSVSISNPDAGACQDLYGQIGETGQVYVAGNALSYFAPMVAAP